GPPEISGHRRRLPHPRDELRRPVEEAGGRRSPLLLTKREEQLPMSQQDLINAIVREVLSELNGSGAKAATAGASKERFCGEKGPALDYRKDYPLAAKRPDLVK